MEERRKVYVEVRARHLIDGTCRPETIKFENDEVYTHVRILDNSRYDLVCVVLFLENARKCLIILDNSRVLPESPQ